MREDENSPHFSISRAPDHDVGMLFVFGNKIGSLEEEVSEIILDIFGFDGDMFELFKCLFLSFAFFLAVYEDECLAIMF